MSIAFFAVISALLYLAAAGLQLATALQQRNGLKHNGISRSVLLLALFALACHISVTWTNVIGSEGVNFSFFKILSLLFLTVNVFCLIALSWRPLQNLLIVLFPVTSIAVLVATLGPDTQLAQEILPAGVLAHVGSSVVAYAVLTLAAIQAALLALQDAQLRQHRVGGVLAVLPPLQLMESMLFELIWVGVIALSVSIVSGFVFMDDIFAQHLVHKTVLSIAAWLLFTVLLWGRHRLGWRSQTAVNLTLVGFTLLLLAFLGSKLVLELVLERS